MPTRSRFTDEQNVPIHRIDENQADEISDKPLSVAYAWGGVVVDADSPDAVAKKFYNPITGVIQYWVKKDKGRLYNPAGATALRTPLSKFEWRKSNPAQFQDYVSYIKPPHSNVLIRRAERS